MDGLLDFFCGEATRPLMESLEIRDVRATNEG
jgi:hypothetical protein